MPTPRDAIFQACLLRYRPIHDDLHGVDCAPCPLALSFGDGPRYIVGRLIFSQHSPNPALSRRDAPSLVFLRVKRSQIERSGNDPSETDNTVFVLDKRG